MIRFTIIDSPIGPVLVAATARGVSTISFGDSRAELEAGFRTAHSGDSCVRDDPGLASWAVGISNLILGMPAGVDFPLDLDGTDFQEAVWSELLRIPAGETRSYGEVARRIKRPKAFRAVAQACGANPVPVIIPCHRVIASDGCLGGFSAGLERKVFLLDCER